MNLAPHTLRRVEARCVERARRYREPPRIFSGNSEFYFFAGACAVLDCFDDLAAKALSDEWMLDVLADRSPTDQSLAAQTAREIERQTAAELETFEARHIAECEAVIRRLESEPSQ